MGALYQPTDQPEVERLVAWVVDQLDEATFQAAWSEGRRMTLDETMANVLEEDRNASSSGRS